MALVLLRHLLEHGIVQQDVLARAFAAEYNNYGRPSPAESSEPSQLRGQAAATRR